MTIFKKFTRFAVLALLVTLITATFANYGFAKTGSRAKKGKTEITFWFYPRYNVPGKENGVYERELANAFMKKNKDVTVKLEFIPWNGGPEKVNIAIASNSMPDSVFDYPGRIIGYGQKGVLVDLMDMLTPKDKKDIPHSILAHCIDNNQLYMYPTAISLYMMAVNKKILKDAGALNLLPLSRPGREWSIGEFEKALEAVKKKVKGVQPIQFFAGNEQGDASVRMFIQNFGADFLNKDYTKVVLNSAAGIKGVQWMVDAYQKGLIAPGAESANNPDAVELFMQGKTAFALSFTPYHRNILLKMIEEKKAPADFDLAFLPYPTAKGVKPKVEAQVYGYCIFNNKDPKRIAASKKFIDFLCNNKENVKAVGAFPVRKSMGNLYDYSEAQFLQTLTSKLGDTGYTVNNYAKVRTLWYPALQAVFVGEKTPKEALDEFAKKATAVINQK
jgi:multiple sugar transport system substrate-binding protein